MTWLVHLIIHNNEDSMKDISEDELSWYVTVEINQKTATSDKIAYISVSENICNNEL